jgi:subtilisin family serine protease
MTAMDAPDIRRFLGGDGRGVRVAVIDDGVDGSVVPGVVGGVALRESGRDADGRPVFRHAERSGFAAGAHGTSVARLIADLAPGAELLDVNALDPAARGPDPSAVAEGLRWAVSAGARVINLSVALDRAGVVAARRWALLEAVESAYRAGAVVVAAAHPDHPGVSAVPATMATPVSADRGPPGGDPLAFSYDPRGRVEFRVPGIDSPGFAAARMSAVVARLLSVRPDLRPFEVKTLLLRLGVP